MNNEKYIRQITLPQVGELGQEKLQHASVLVIGIGGLGNAVLPYLASSGIGTIGIIDGDTIAMSNLHRQVLFSEKDINRLKASVAYDKLSTQFPEVSFKAYKEFLNVENALTLFKEYDIILDATDTINIRYLINDACVLTNTPFVHASVYRFQFQIATFNVDRSGTYRCLYPNPPKTVQSCSEAGVMPGTVAMAGLYQVNEVIKYMLDIGEVLTNKMILMDTMTNQQHQFLYQKKNHTFITEAFFTKEYQKQDIDTISFENALKLEGLFLDVRQISEEPKLVFKNYAQIPLQNLEENLLQLSAAKRIFIFCQSGKRSALAYQLLKKKNVDTVFCLKDNAPELKSKIIVGSSGV